jgi:putative hydrolase of the HAD superfamily
LFDLDNTLIDRSKTVKSFAQPFLLEFACDLLCDVDCEELSKSLLELDQGGYATHAQRSAALQKLPIWKHDPVQRSELEAYWQQWIPNHSVLIEGCVEGLFCLKDAGFALGIVTNGQTRNQTDKLHSSGLLKMFDCVVISESAGIRKPSQKIFQLALDKLNAQASKTLFVGDHMKNDYCGALNAGLTPILYAPPERYDTAHQEPILTAKNMTEVIEIALNYRLSSKG